MARTYATWNPSDKNGAITLSNGNLTAVVSPGAAYCGIRATKHKSSGKWYWELTLTLSNEGSTDELTAVCDSSVGLSVQMGIYATAWVWRGNGFYYHDNAGINCGVGYTTTDILQVALDMDNGKIWYGKNGTWNGSGNPATGANPSQTGLTGDLFPAMMIYYKGNITANFGASAFTYTVPSGFNEGVYELTPEIDANLSVPVVFTSELMKGRPGDIEGNLSIPIVLSSSIQSFNVNGNIQIVPSLLSTMYMEVWDINAAIAIPVTISGTVWGVSNTIRGNLAFPITIAGTVYSYPNYAGLLYGTIPSMELDATGYSTPIGIGQLELPFFTLSAEAYGDPIGMLNKSLPMFRLGTVGEELPVGIANLILPSLKISTVVDSGNIATFSASLPIFRLSTTGYLDVLATGDMTIPLFGISAFISPSTYTSLVMNLLNRGLTEFANYEFNSMCYFNGKNLGATATGIHDLDSGTNDNGTKIDWNFTVGYIDLQIKTKKKLREMWMGCQIDGNVVVTVKKADGTEYEYKGESFEETERGVRVKFGKGIKTRYLSLDVKNEDVSTMELDAIRLMLDKYEGRR